MRNWLIKQWVKLTLKLIRPKIQKKIGGYMAIKGNRALWGCIAGVLAAAGAAVKEIAEGQFPSNETIMLLIGSATALFAVLKGKRIEEKLDALNGK